jgi:hypothetical protein
VREDDDWFTVYSSHGRLMKFKSTESAEEWYKEHLSYENTCRRRLFEAARERNTCSADLYEKRVQALKDAQLWIQPGEIMSPLIRVAGRREPREVTVDNHAWRILNVTDMDPEDYT